MAAGNSIVGAAITAAIVGMISVVLWVELSERPAADTASTSASNAPAVSEPSACITEIANADAVLAERQHVEEILGMSASKEAMKWRLQEMTEIDRLEAARRLAALSQQDADTPLETMISLLWERWERAENGIPRRQ